MAEDYFYDEDQYEDEDNGPPVPLFWRILGKIIKYTAIGIIIAINALLIWRVFFSANEPSVMETISSNEALAHAYKEYLAGDMSEPFAVYQAGKDNIGTDEAWHKRLDVETGKVADNFFAQFFLTDVVFFPEAGQVQTVLRYNKSCLKHLAEDFELEKVPLKSDDVFVIVLEVTYKPDGSSSKTVRIDATLTASASTSLYSYRQLSFEGLPDFESITDMNIEIYYKGEAESADPYAEIDIYDASLGTRPYDLDKKDVGALTKE
ncbi:MAG: hypothetical protein ACI3XI_02695 [Eubacteriales bacterium]